MDWVIGKWYRTRDGHVGECVKTERKEVGIIPQQPIGVMFGDENLFHYCVGGEFFRPGRESRNDIVAGPFNSAENAKQSTTGGTDYDADLETLMDSLLVRLDLAASDSDRLAVVAAMLAVRRVGAAVWEMEAALASIGIK